MKAKVPKPVVTACYERGASEQRNVLGETILATNGVEVRVEYRVGNEDSALLDLDFAVDYVKQQIEETRK